MSAKGKHEGHLFRERSWGGISKELGATWELKHSRRKETGKERSGRQASQAEGSEYGDTGGETSPRQAGSCQGETFALYYLCARLGPHRLLRTCL